MSLDRALEALALRGALHVDVLSDHEQIGTNHGARLQFVGLRRRYPELSDGRAGLDAGFGEMPGLGLADPRGAASTVHQLDSGVAVGLGRLDLGNPVAGDVDDGDRNGLAVVGEDPHHPDLATQKAEAGLISGGTRRRAGRFS